MSRPCPECKMIVGAVRIGTWVDDGSSRWAVIRCEHCGVIRLEPEQPPTPTSAPPVAPAANETAIRGR